MFGINFPRFFRQGKNLKIFSWVIFLTILPVLLDGCHHSDNRDSNVVGYLGKKTVTLKNLTDTARFMGLGSLSSRSPSEWSPSERKAILLEAVQDVFLEEEGQKRNIQVYPQEVMRYIQNHFDQPENGLEKYARKALFLKKTEDALEPLPNVTLSTERLFYRDHPNLFQIPRQAIVDHIVVAKQKEAESIRDALVKGSSFSKLAKLESLGTEASSGGRMKPYAHGTMPPPFDTVFTLKPGEISDVLSSSYGYHIFRLEKFVPQHTVSFSQEKKWIKETLIRKKRKEFLTQWLAEKLQNSSFQIAPNYDRIFFPIPVTILKNQTLHK